MVKRRRTSKRVAQRRPCLVLATSQDILAAVEEESANESDNGTSESNPPAAILTIDNSDKQQENTQPNPTGSKDPETHFSGNDEGSLEDILGDIIDISNDEPGPGSAVNPSNSIAFCKRGPKHSEVWDAFITVRNEKGKIVSNKCRHCLEDVSARAHRMNSHRVTCAKKKTQLKLMKESDIATSFQDTRCLKKPADGDNEVTVLDHSASKTTPGSSHFSQPSVSGFVKRIKSEEKDKIDMALGRMLFACNLPFNTVENSMFQEFVNILNAAYRLPSHDVIGSRVLEHVYLETEVNMKRELNGQKAILSQDGWSTCQNAPVIGHCLTTEKKTYFLEAVATGESKKDAEYCLSLWENAKKTAEDKFSCDVIGVVTDNCSTMKLMQTKIKERYPRMIGYGCHSHLLNLIGVHFTPDELQQKINRVQVFMRNHHFASERMKTMKLRRPVVPTNTRWNSQIDCFLSFQENQTKYIDILREMKSKPNNSNELKKIQDVLDIVTESDLYEELASVIDVLKPVALGLDKLQSNVSTVSDAVQIWLGIEATIPVNYSENAYFKSKINEAVRDVAIAAYIVHPIYRGANLSKERYEIGLRWLREVSPLLVVLATSLKQNKSDHFIESLLDMDVASKMRPASWWRECPGLPPNLLDVVENLLILPSSSAGIERSFSVLNNIMTDQRNRLGVEKAGKLCLIYQSLRLREDELEKRRLTRKRKFSSAPTAE